MSSRGKKLTLVNLRRHGAFFFNLHSSGDMPLPFPRSITTQDRANWDMADTIGGLKPLQYANREPARLKIDECWLEKSVNESITQDLEELRKLLDDDGYGAPPLLLLICGDWSVRCTLEELEIERTHFTRENIPWRARLSMTFLVIEQRERVTVRIVDPATGGAYE